MTTDRPPLPPLHPSQSPSDPLARPMLDRAARAAIRGAGDVEPNPMVGCVIARGDQVIGIGHHRRFGGPHAEREALDDCRRRGHDPRGATVYCTLEPCRHFGKQPPCTDALRQAGVARVVYARPDPGVNSGGGAGVLENAGIPTLCSSASPLATRISDPFVHAVRTGRPWVIAKWAQTLDGRIATRTGQSRWITGPLMRRRVHRLRARVDAVMVGVGTVLADDPLLTARDVRRVRRPAARVVLDTSGRTPPGCALLRQPSDAAPPTVVLTTNPCFRCSPARAVVVPRGPGGVDLHAAMRALHGDMGCMVVLVEAGPGVLGSLLEADLVDEAFVHIAPMILGDAQALPAAVGRVAEDLGEARRFGLVRVKQLRGDLELWYRRETAMP